MKKQSAFTLIELLVVISIIALLVSLLLPALSAARDAARASVCLSNQRQLTIGVMSYAADFGGMIVTSSRNSANSFVHWSTYVSGRKTVNPAGNLVQSTEYVPAGDVYGCASLPAFPLESAGNQLGTGRYSYGMYTPRSADQAARGWSFYKYIPNPNPSGSTVRPSWHIIDMFDIQASSEVALLADATTYRRNWGGPINAFVGRPTGVWNPDSTAAAVLDYGGRVRLIHSETANVVFADGHGVRQDSQTLYDSKMSIKNFYDMEGNGFNY